jgi:hypothetical protein
MNVDPENNPEELEDIRWIAYWLDNCIPIPLIGVRIGLDPFIGLVPVVGDFFGAAIGLYIIVRAANLGVEGHIILLMVGNILLDSLVGIVPGLGDVIDAGWKANARNLALIKDNLGY